MGWLDRLSSGGDGKPVVLLVEDEEDLQQLGTRVLTGVGVKVVLAVNGSEALAKAAEHAPELILLDIVMPVMDGLQALELLKKDPKTKDIPVIMLSSRPKDAERATTLGALGFLPKPYDIDQFAARVRRMLGLPEPA